ncbi:MAG: PQQ-binding-like beta-propeller repeat protein [Acidobacteriota bacterium]
MKHRIIFATGFLGLSACLVLQASDPAARDWPMWGGSPARNMISPMPGLPVSWDVGKQENVKWTAKLGSPTYGTPVVAGGHVYIGTNNELARNPNEAGDRGVLMCFRESDGHFLWQQTHEKLADDNMDWPETGVCSSPLVERDRLYYVSNRGEVVCLDTRGDGKGGSKIVWIYDMLKKLDVIPHNKVSSSAASYGDLLYVNTSNGTDESGEKVPSPDAPTIIALEKDTGKLVWKAKSIIGRIYDGQWSSPAVGTIAGITQVVIGEGDGWVRSYEALTGAKLWEFDTNPKGAIWPRTAGIVLATPVIWDNKVYVANGQDPESGIAPANLYAIDATKKGDISQSGLIWRYADIKRSISSVAIHNGLLFAADLNGFLHCLDVNTGKAYWTHDTMAGIWASPMVIDGKVYLGNADGEVIVLDAAKEKKLVFQTNMGSTVYSTFVPANGTLFVASRDTLFALETK